MNYSNVKKEVDRWAIQHELVVPPGSVVKFNDQTDLLDDSTLLAKSERNFDLAFAMGKKLAPTHVWGSHTRLF